MMPVRFTPGAPIAEVPAMSLTALAMQIAALQRRVQVVAVVLPAIRRAFDQLTWDEGLHPRGPGGKFIGGDGVRAEREAVHIDRALAAFKVRAKGLDAATVQLAHERMRWKDPQGNEHHGIEAIRDHKTAVQGAAERGAARNAASSQTLREMAFLRNLYAQRAGSNLNAASVARLKSEVAVLDQHAKRFGRQLTTNLAKGLSAADRAAIIAQVDAGIAQDLERAKLTPPANTRG